VRGAWRLCALWDKVLDLRLKLERRHVEACFTRPPRGLLCAEGEGGTRVWQVLRLHARLDSTRFSRPCAAAGAATLSLRTATPSHLPRDRACEEELQHSERGAQGLRPWKRVACIPSIVMRTQTIWSALPMAFGKASIVALRLRIARIIGISSSATALWNKVMPGPNNNSIGSPGESQVGCPD
jgi:hypothetical protein